MRGVSASGGDHGPTVWLDRGWRRVVALLAVGALLVAGFAHLAHEHPHRLEQELCCAVCTTPLGQTAAAPTLAPPSVRPEAPPEVAAAAPPAARPPLSFSPKQSPPPSA